MVLSKKPKELQSLNFSDPRLSMPLNKLDRFADMVRFLKNKPRQTVLQVLESNKGMTVSDLYTKLGWDQSYTSQMLGSLKRAGLVYAQREGHFVTYFANKDLLKQVKQFVDSAFD